ncbi:MAG: hypothetical protein HC819_12740 [Cyclobacteriaceae bacterium]|nr:hypothetical protein [Cyclobacteriaceae bacterium]
MKTASLAELKRALADYSPKELMALCLRMAKFKIDNKELLHYLVFESENEASFLEEVKMEIEEDFEYLNIYSVYHFKKGARKILTRTNKYIKYSGQTQTRVELLICFSKNLRNKMFNFQDHPLITNFYDRQIINIQKSIAKLDEDLQFDYVNELKTLGIPIER